MTTAPRVSARPLPSTDALRRAALARSARRGARVAFWRLGFRWFLWGFGWLLVALGALTVLLLLLWGLWRATAGWRQGTPPAASAPVAQPASAALPAPATPPPVRYRLRIDDGETTVPAAAQSPSASRPPNPP